MEFVVNDLAKRFGITDKRVKKLLCPEYDITQRGTHKQVDLVVRGETIEVDEKLVELIRLLNLYDDTTVTSCQHDLFGWASIAFSFDGYSTLLKSIVEKSKLKYGDKYDTAPALNRFQFHTDFFGNRVDCSCLLCDGMDDVDFRVNMRFTQSEIPVVVRELHDIFE